MDTRYDTVIITVIGVILGIWALYSLRAWLKEPGPLVLKTIPINEDLNEGPAVDQLHIWSKRRAASNPWNGAVLI